MSESLRPWICDYLIEAGEEYGSNLLAVPLFSKRKKAQIIEFLTYPSDDEPTAIWAIVSDKDFVIPIKFSKDAVSTYTKLHGQRFTYAKTAIVSITQFRPFFSRTPSRSGQRMSTNARLAIECESVTLIGSLGEAMFGSPKEIDSHSDLRLWTEGLRKDGGAGNVLKNRKSEMEASRKENVVSKQPAAAAPLQFFINADKLPARRTENNSPKHIWVPQFTNNAEFRCPPANVKRLLDKMKVYGETSTTEDINPSPRKRPRIDEENDENVASSLFSSPERLISDWVPTPEEGLSPIGAPVKTLERSQATPGQRQEMLPRSSPPSSSLAAPETVLYSQTLQSQISRKVPRPNSPIAPSLTDGPGRVLVPNSDTSLSHSQSQSQSQSQRKAGVRLERSRENEDGGSQPQQDGSDSEVMDEDGDDSETEIGNQAIRGPVTEAGVNKSHERASENHAGGARQADNLEEVEEQEGGVEHDEEAWRTPAFMRHPRRSKLEGFSAELRRVKVGRGGHGWVSWGELVGIAERIKRMRGRER